MKLMKARRLAVPVPWAELAFQALACAAYAESGETVAPW